MSQLKKHILILFLIPLIAKSAFVQAIEESSAVFPATDAEIAFNEAVIQKPAKKVVPWYKRMMCWRDLVIIGALLTGLYKFNGEYNNRKKVHKIFKFFLFTANVHYDDAFEDCYCTTCSNKRHQEYKKHVTEKKETNDIFASAGFKGIYSRTIPFSEQQIKRLSEQDQASFYGTINMLRMRFDTQVTMCNGNAQQIKQLEDQLEFDLQKFFNFMQRRI